MLKLLFTAPEGSSSSTDPATAPTTGAAAAAGAASPATAALECPICLQTCIHPARLPCGHIFCFLCVKVRIIRCASHSASRRKHLQLTLLFILRRLLFQFLIICWVTRAPTHQVQGRPSFVNPCAYTQKVIPLDVRQLE